LLEKSGKRSEGTENEETQWDDEQANWRPPAEEGWEKESTLVWTMIWIDKYLLKKGGKRREGTENGRGWETILTGMTSSVRNELRTWDAEHASWQRRGGRRRVPFRCDRQIWIDKYLPEKSGKRREGTEYEELNVK